MPRQGQDAADLVASAGGRLAPRVRDKGAEPNSPLHEDFTIASDKHLNDLTLRRPSLGFAYIGLTCARRFVSYRSREDDVNCESLGAGQNGEWYSVPTCSSRTMDRSRLFFAFFKSSLEGTQGRLLQTADGMYCMRRTFSMRPALVTHRLPTVTRCQLPTGGSQIENQRTRKCCWQAIQSYKPVSFASPR